MERQINRARTVRTPDSESLQQELAADHERLKHLQQATDHLAKAKTRLQMIEATSRRKLTQGETDLMMQRLGAPRINCRWCSRSPSWNNRRCSKRTPTKAFPDLKPRIAQKRNHKRFESDF